MIGPLGVLRTESWQKTEVEKNHCDISPQDSWYIGCDGEKKKLPAQQTSFEVQWRKAQNYKKKACFIKVKQPQNTSKIISDLITTSIHFHALAKFTLNKVVETQQVRYEQLFKPKQSLKCEFFNVAQQSVIQSSYSRRL